MHFRRKNICLFTKEKKKKIKKYFLPNIGLGIIFKLREYIFYITIEADI